MCRYMCIDITKYNREGSTLVYNLVIFGAHASKNTRYHKPSYVTTTTIGRP